jgi:flagellar hook-length control protein FliK
VSQAITLTTIIPAQELKAISQERDIPQTMRQEGDEPSRKFLKLLEEKKQGAVQDQEKAQTPGRLEREQSVEKQASSAMRKRDLAVEIPQQDRSREMTQNVRALVERTGTLQKDLQELKLQLKRALEEPKRAFEQIKKTPNVPVNMLIHAPMEQGARRTNSVSEDKTSRETKKIGAVLDARERGEVAVKPKAVVVDLRDSVKTQTAEKSAAIKKETGSKSNTAKLADDVTKSDGQESGTIRYFTKASQIADAHVTNAAHEPEHGGAAGASQTVREPVTLPRLAETLKNEMVKHTGIILRNNGEGEINMVLKPESLGSVRVKFSVEDNNIVGKIFVENNTVKQIVESNLDNLTNSFHDQGFGKSMIEVFVQGEGMNQPQSRDEAHNIIRFADRRGDYVDPVFSTQETSPDYEYVNIVL